MILNRIRSWFLCRQGMYRLLMQIPVHLKEALISYLIQAKKKDFVVLQNGIRSFIRYKTQLWWKRFLVFELSLYYTYSKYN